MFHTVLMFLILIASYMVMFGFVEFSEKVFVSRSSARTRGADAETASDSRKA